jgi:uracil-DNA glycosylase family 4
VSIESELAAKAAQVEAARRSTKGYDAEAHGARCKVCPLHTLREGGPVPPELYGGAKVMVVAEAPGSDEVDGGRPLIGRSGVEATQGLLAVGLPRHEVSWSNVLLCRPPGNDLAAALYKIQKTNKEREKRGEATLPTPMECCRPRLVRELAMVENVITMGKVAMNAVTQEAKGIFDLRGTPIDGYLQPDGDFVGAVQWNESGMVTGKPLHVFPTLHPAFVLRKRRWTKVFRADLGRATRWFNNTMKWAGYAPENYHPTPAELRAFLNAGADFYSYDVETDAKEPLIAKLRCIGFSTTEGGLVVPFASIHGGYHFYGAEEFSEILDIIRTFFTNPKILKVGWNAGYYDRIVIEEQIGVTPAPLTDGIILHRNVDSELPHGLGFAGTVYTDVSKAWKAGNVAKAPKTDQQLHEYNLTDCVVTARCVAPLVQAIDLRDQRAVVSSDHKIQGFCAGMHRLGMPIDPKARDVHDARLKKEAAEHRMACRDVVGDREFNPGSVEQVKKLLFTDWGLEPESLTKLGEPSTDDDSIRAFLSRHGLPAAQYVFLNGLRKFRRAVKLRGTYITRMRPMGELVPIDELALNAEDPDDAKELGESGSDLPPDPEGMFTYAHSAKVREEKKGKVVVIQGLIMGDGRVHPHWNCHVAVTGRLSSSGPNAQNWPYPIRDMVQAEAGNLLVGIDADQIELRMCSALAGAKRYLEIFHSIERGIPADPHAMTAELLYGKLFIHANELDRKRLREFAKRFSYAVLYGATVETVWETITSAEDAKGNLPFAHVTLRETRLLYNKWLAANPEFVTWWETVVDEWKRNGYLREPLLGRRCDFSDLDLEEIRNKIINYKAQACAASIVNTATIALIEGALPFGRWGPNTGIIQQGHDSLLAEVPAAQTKKVAAAMKEALTIRVPGLDVLFTGKPKIGARWTECA